MFMVSHLIGFGAGGGVVPATVSFASNAADPTNTDAFTFSGQSIGTAAANRTVIVVTTGSNNTRTVSTLTVAGNSASLVKRQQNSGLTTEIWAVAVASGTTGDVVVTWDGTQGNGCQIGVFAAYGISASAHATAGGTGNPAGSTINIPAGGILVAAVGDGSGSATTTWTGPTERFDSATASGSLSGASDAYASAQTSYTVSALLTGSFSTSMAAASWGPA